MLRFFSSFIPLFKGMFCSTQLFVYTAIILKVHAMNSRVPGYGHCAVKAVRVLPAGAGNDGGQGQATAGHSASLPVCPVPEPSSSTCQRGEDLAEKEHTIFTDFQEENLG